MLIAFCVGVQVAVGDEQVTGMDEGECDDAEDHEHSEHESTHIEQDERVFSVATI